ncbi:MAG: AI-2E family transporter [Methanobrevibacter sp.]|jgi:predicted PurR-regulated permease PerM|nr:AI-2E family transporter [Methanobrevibacter sp.]
MKNKIKNNINSPFIIIGILLIISFLILIPVINMVILGGIIAYGLRPIANKFKSKVKYDSIAISLAIILVLIPLILLLIYSLLSVVDMAYSIMANNYEIATNSTFNASDIVNQYLPTELQSSTDSFIVAIEDLIKDIFKMLINYIIELIKSLPMVSLQLFVLIASVYYFTRDGYKVKEYVKSFIPNERHSYFEKMISEIKTVLKSIFYGHFLTAIIIGIIAGIGYFILGYEFALFLGVLTGICQLIPILGPWVVYFIIVILDILSQNYLRAATLLLFGFGLSLSDMYIRPQLAGKYVDIPALILLLGFLAGPIVFGLVGLILGPLILGITYAVLKSYKEEVEEKRIGE